MATYEDVDVTMPCDGKSGALYSILSLKSEGLYPFSDGTNALNAFVLMGIGFIICDPFVVYMLLARSDAFSKNKHFVS